jgi:hypothetical protein
MIVNIILGGSAYHHEPGCDDRLHLWWSDHLWGVGGLELPGRILLLFHHAQYHRIRGHGPGRRSRSG